MDINDLVMAGGSPPAKFTNIGDLIVGTILSTSTEQQRDFTTGDLKFWDDGKPMMQGVFTLQTEQRDPLNPDDDGKRRLFAKGQMLTAIRTAVTTAGAQRIEVGGKLAVQFSALGEAKRAGMSPPKHYTAKYEPPTAAAVNDLLAAAPQAAPVAPQPAPAVAADLF